MDTSFFVVPMSVIGNVQTYVKVVLPVDVLHLFRNPGDAWEFDIDRCDAIVNGEYNNSACWLRTRACLYGPCEVFNNAEVYDFRKCSRSYREDHFDLSKQIQGMSL